MPKITKLNDLERRNRIIKGSWKLSPRHNLSYQSEERSSKNLSSEYEWETSFVAVEARSLVMSVTQKQDNGSVVTSLLKLTGVWRANAHNQLEFEVKRQSGKNDVLTFSGNWKAGKNHEIIYEYRARKLRSRDSQIQTLTFSGFWDLTEKSRLTYLVEGDSESAFRFRGAFQSPSISAKKGEIRYQLGAQASGKTRAGKKTVTLFGKWKLSDKLELVFEMDYGRKLKREMRFGAEFAITKKLTVAAQLTNQQHTPIGVEVLLTKDFLDAHARAFLGMQKTSRVKAIEAGVIIPW